TPSFFILCVADYCSKLASNYKAFEKKSLNVVCALPSVNMVHPCRILYGELFCYAAKAMLYQPITVNVLEESIVYPLHYRFPPLFQIVDVSSGNNVFLYCGGKEKCRVCRPIRSSVEESPPANYHGELALGCSLACDSCLVTEEIVNCCCCEAVVPYGQISSKSPTGVSRPVVWKAR